MADGRVLTGFSLPYVAVYSNSGSTVTYANGAVLARGVSVSVELDDAGDDNIFYANNSPAESVGGEFTGGTVTLTVDGLFPEAETLIYGLPAADTDGFYNYGKNMNIPYVGIGFVCRYMSSGVTSYVPVVLTKCRFNPANLSANTQEDEIDWQTQELTAKMFIDDSADQIYKKVGTAQATETAAANLIKTALNIQ